MTTQTADIQYHPVPEWLNEQYVQKALRKHFKDDKLKLHKLNIKPASPVGENYTSIMNRITIEFSDSHGQLSKCVYLVKTTYESDDPDAEHFKRHNVYVREMDMYELILPKLTKLFHEVGSTEKLFAETIFVDREHSTIIFEDLSLLNYVALDRTERLDLVKVKLALRKLAMFHATAAVLNEREPGTFEKNFDLGFFSRRSDAFKPIYMVLLEALIRYVNKNADLKVKYAEKLIALLDNHMEYGARVFDVTEHDFMTLAHGDFWTTNIMLLSNKNKEPCDVILIDFQYSAWCSPTIDLHYFFNTSLREDLRTESTMNELVQYYYYILSNTLSQLKYKGHIPSLYKFNLEYQARYYMALFAAFVFQPLMIYDGEGISNLHNLRSTTDYGIWLKDDYFNNEAVKEYLDKLLPIFEQKGLLDRMD